MPTLKHLLSLVRSTERLARRLRDPHLSPEMFVLLSTQYHRLQKRWYALAAAEAGDAARADPTIARRAA